MFDFSSVFDVFFAVGRSLLSCDNLDLCELGFGLEEFGFEGLVIDDSFWLLGSDLLSFDLETLISLASSSSTIEGSVGDSRVGIVSRGGADDVALTTIGGGGDGELRGFLARGSEDWFVDKTGGRLFACIVSTVLKKQ